jgi:hypothetical protein
VFENKVLRRIFGQKRDEVARGCRKLYIEELDNLYSVANIIREKKIKEVDMSRTCSMHGG